MAHPRLKLEIAFSTAPLAATPAWVDVTEWLRNERISIRKGRQSQLDLVEAGTMSLTLSNLDGRFTPGNTVGPYYPNVLTRRRIRLTAEHETGTYRLFDGFVQRWPRRYPAPDDCIVPITATDGFLFLSRAELSGSYPQERSDLRIARLLDAVGWPAADRSLATGKSTVQASTLANAGAKQHLDKVIDTELGVFFFDGAGIAIFQDRHYRSNNATVQATFGGPGGLPYTDVQPEDDDQFLYNDVRVQREGGVEQAATDAASQSAYGKSVLPRSGLLCLNDTQALDQAEYLLGRHKSPQTRIEQLLIDGREDDYDLWEAMLGLEMSDRIRIIRREPGHPIHGGSADVLDETVFIENVQHDILDKGSNWLTRFGTSPTNFTIFWLLGIAGASELGQTTRIGY